MYHATSQWETFANRLTSCRRFALRSATLVLLTLERRAAQRSAATAFACLSRLNADLIQCVTKFPRAPATARHYFPAQSSLFRNLLHLPTSASSCE